jgi:hypothetical protein
MLFYKHRSIQVYWYEDVRRVDLLGAVLLNQLYKFLFETTQDFEPRKLRPQVEMDGTKQQAREEESRQRLGCVTLAGRRGYSLVEASCRPVDLRLTIHHCTLCFFSMGPMQIAAYILPAACALLLYSPGLWCHASSASLLDRVCTWTCFPCLKAASGS